MAQQRSGKCQRVEAKLPEEGHPERDGAREQQKNQKERDEMAPELVREELNRVEAGREERTSRTKAFPISSKHAASCATKESTSNATSSVKGRCMMSSRRCSASTASPMSA